jgi:phosphatidylserine/phosphatidylglycerophosphate/cardiolipin synthase-like enzyme
MLAFAEPDRLRAGRISDRYTTTMTACCARAARIAPGGHADTIRIRKLPNIGMAVGSYIKVKTIDGWIKERGGIGTHVNWVHTKFMLVDPLGRAPIVITGSANWSLPSVNTKDMVVIKGDKRVADIYFGDSCASLRIIASVNRSPPIGKAVRAIFLESKSNGRTCAEHPHTRRLVKERGIPFTHRRRTTYVPSLKKLMHTVDAPDPKFGNMLL